MTFAINEPATISFSGGRSSAYMLWRILDAQGGLRTDQTVVFANTGKEMPETLDFIRDCAAHWDVPILWVEYRKNDELHERGRYKGTRKKNGRYVFVDYASASRNGEPFMQLIEDKRMVPNSMTRFCTIMMKIKAIHWVGDLYGCSGMQVIGIRVDEPRRALKIHGKVEDGRENYCPLWVDKIDRETINDFWCRHEFDLALPKDGAWSNCDLCFLKGRGKRVSIARQRPDLVKWWIDAETLATNLSSASASTFRPNDSYRAIAQDAQAEEMASYQDEDTPCFCGD